MTGRKSANLIDAEKYFVLHSPRQTGKTSTLLAMMDVLNREGEYLALYVNIKAAQAAREDVSWGIKHYLCGVRDVRAYRIQTPHKETITGDSAFFAALWEDTCGQP
ncbi:hypothetical protein [Thiothrix nivea]|uniref:hypothetical protein n=1 Tax=Thiothrix nivea TaxID=1031 RepID=UPI0002F331B1|nr:hypothetical protein [Thiothrix nivea]